MQSTHARAQMRNAHAFAYARTHKHASLDQRKKIYGYCDDVRSSWANEKQKKEMEELRKDRRQSWSRLNGEKMI